MVDLFSRFISSNSVYSKTADAVHVADYKGEIFLFLKGVPMRHINFLHYAIQAVNPSVHRHGHIEEEMNSEAFALLPYIGLSFGSEDEAGRYASGQLRAFMKVEKGGSEYEEAVFNLLNEIDNRVQQLDPSFSVSDLDDNVTIHQS